MTPVALPNGTYFSVIGNVRLEAGGQTKLALLRHRLFSLHTDHELPILTYNPVPSYDPIRTELRRQGQLLEHSRLLNMHEDLRVRALDNLPLANAPLANAPLATAPLATAFAYAEDDVDDGYRWRRRQFDAAGNEVCWEYLRADGSVYARTPPTHVTGPVALLDRAGRTVGSWPALGGLWRWWTRQLLPAEGRVFLLSDSRFIAEELSTMGDGRIHILHQMHNPHLSGARRWNSPVSASYTSSMDNLARLDALISLSDRQRADIAARYGHTDNLFVVPNPVEPAPPPTTPVIRRPASLAMIARLDGQKRVDRAIEAFARVVRVIPEATLDIYGDGELLDPLQRQIDAAGLAAAVTLHGFDPHARDRLWAASVFWLTSQFEGYPLSTLEAMSRGCPVLSFDMKYGPREQIHPGVDGYLFATGDTNALADGTIALLRDQPRLARMRVAAQATAAAHDHRQFLADWATTVRQVVSQKPDRTTVTAATWTVAAPADDSSISGTLILDTPDADRLDTVRIGVQVYSPDHDALLAVPTQWQRSGAQFSFSASPDAALSAATVPGAHRLVVRAEYVWHNNAGHTQICTRTVAPATPKRSARTVIGAALRRSGLRKS